jgi:hypothetical protein
MAITAVVKRPNLIVANSVGLTTTQSNSPISLKNNVTGAGQNYIHNILDVIEGQPQDGYTLVYNATLDKYEVKAAVISAASLDGGTF